MPLMVIEGYSGWMILPLLKPGHRNKAVGFEDTIMWLIACLNETRLKTVYTLIKDDYYNN